MRTASRSRVSAGFMAATIAGLALMAFTDSTALVVPGALPVGAIVVGHAIGTSSPRSSLHEPVPSPVEIRRDIRNSAVQPSIPNVSVEHLSTVGMGRSRDDYINAAAAISQHIASLDVPTPREVVRVVALPPIDTRRLPEQPAAMSTADLSGLFDLAAQSMAALPVPQSTVSRARKHVVSISQGGIKRVAGFVKRSNVPAPTRIALPVPKRSLVASGTLRTHPLHTPVIKSASAAIVTSALMVLSGQ
jgi:hypothetical protein